MDLETKLKAYCECQLQRTWYDYDTAFQRYLQSMSAFDLALASEASQRYAITRRICNNILDIIQYHFYTGDKT